MSNIWKSAKLEFSLVKPYVKTICFTMVLPVVFAAINRSLLTGISFAMCFIAMTTGYTFSVTEKTLWNGFMVFYQSEKVTWLLGDIFLSLSWVSLH